VRRSSGSPRAVCAPDKLKGVLSARQAAIALSNGFAKAGVDPVQVPLADGGEGTAETLELALGGEWRPAAVVDPFGRPVQTSFLRRRRDARAERQPRARREDLEALGEELGRSLG
jgi:glycerate kinase